MTKDVHPFWLWLHSPISSSLHEVATLHCNMMTKSLWCISIEVRKLPHYDGLTYVSLFLDEFEREVPKEKHFQMLELALRATPTVGGVHTKRTLLVGRNIKG